MYSERMRLCLICFIDAQTRMRLVLEKNNVLVRLCTRVLRDMDAAARAAALASLADTRPSSEDEVDSSSSGSW